MITKNAPTRIVWDSKIKKKKSFYLPIVENWHITQSRAYCTFRIQRHNKEIRIQALTWATDGRQRWRSRGGDLARDPSPESRKAPRRRHGNSCKFSGEPRWSPGMETGGNRDWGGERGLVWRDRRRVTGDCRHCCSVRGATSEDCFSESWR